MTGEPTIPAGERTVAAGARTVPAGSGGAGGGAPPTGPSGAEPSDRGPILLLTGSALAGLVLGAVLALAVGSGTATPSPSTSTSAASTTTSSSTTSSSTTSTSAVPAPLVTGFGVSPSSPTCLPNGAVLVTWSTQRAQSVTLTLDGASLGTFSPSGSRSAPFACPPHAHTFGIVATGANGQQATRSVQVNAGAPPPSTSSTTTTT